MLQGHDIITFCNDWGGDPLSKKHIMERFARHNRVLWVNSIGNRNPTASVRDFKRVVNKLGKFMGGCRQVNENLWVFSPIAIPFHGNALARALNRRFLSWSLRAVCRKLGFRNPITWTYVPSSADVVGTLNEKFICYQCVDEYSEFTNTDKHAILEMERRLMAKCNMVVVSAGPLLNSKRHEHCSTFLVTHGVDVEHFRKALMPETVVPAEIAALRKPVIGFYGLIADWIDLRLIRWMAERRPNWSFVLIGKADTNMSAVQGIPNVHLLGRKPYEALPAYCKGIDVAISPFVLNELTRAANPLKLREYLAAGLPTVSTALPEAERISDMLHIARGDQHFLDTIDGIIASGKTGPQWEISRGMDSETWDAKVEQLSRLALAVRPELAQSPPSSALEISHAA